MITEIRLAVTGHRRLERPLGWLVDRLEELVLRGEVTGGLSILAPGADQIFAEALVRTGKPLTAIVPCAGYQQTLHPVDRLTYRRLLGRASRVIRLDHSEPCERAYYDAGERMVQLADAIIAIWRGTPAYEPGGTGDVVKLARRYRRPIVRLDPRRRTTSE